MAVQKGKTAIADGVSTEVFDAGLSLYANLILTNRGAVPVWIALNGEAAVIEEGFDLAPVGTDGSKVAIPSQGKYFHPIVNAIADGAAANVTWQRY